MKVFKVLTNDEEAFDEFVAKQHKDDEKLMEYFSNCSHKDFNLALLNLGTLLNTVSTYFGFVRKQIDDILDSNSQSMSRKMNKIVKELNEKINYRYDFDENVQVVSELVLYEGELYVYINKCDFIDEILLKGMENW